MISYIMPNNTPTKIPPISMAVTEFHYLILYPHALVSQSKISGKLLLYFVKLWKKFISTTLNVGELQQEDDLLLLLSRGDNEGEPLVICRDTVKNSLWMITTTSIYQVSKWNNDCFIESLTFFLIFRLQQLVKIEQFGQCILQKL